MKVDIWSDIRCPFCYIGKRKFEKALEQFEHKDEVKVTWHSFELDPALNTQLYGSSYDYLADRKGMSRKKAEHLHEQIAETAKQWGLEFNFDKSVIANTFDAHRLIQLAQSKGLGDAAEERLFKAYFTEGKDISDKKTLTQLGVEIGLDAGETEQMLKTRAYSDEVRYDENKANAIGIKGVPFFIFNEKYGLSGAQEPGVFLEMLNDSWEEYKTEGKSAKKTK